ncbi:MAG: type II secretion system F family protein, partial [Pseudomonadota bacterium]|nr:type II secretion system F family protein [Pseudomonadota bacterium]
WPVLLGFVIVLFWLARTWVRSPSGHFQWDRFKLRIPVAGKIVHRASLARFARSLSLSIQSGMPVVTAMGLIAKVVDNEFLALKIEWMRDAIARGESILQTAKSSKVFTPMVLQMIAVGEESGAIDELMQEVAELYEREVKNDLETLNAQIEPILIVALGVLVLIVALGVFLPIWDLSRAAFGGH